MSDTSISYSELEEMRVSIAKRRIDFFRERFDEEHLVFAQHASLPLALTPELLYSLWYRFQHYTDRDGRKRSIPWIAVADLLLSSLCSEVGYELYEMDTAVQANLLEGLKSTFGEKHLKVVAEFLLGYAQQQLLSQNSRVHSIAKTQEWIALYYTYPDEFARKLALALLESTEQKNKSEQRRIASIIGLFPELASLKEFYPLLVLRKAASIVRSKQPLPVEVEGHLLKIVKGTGERTDKPVDEPIPPLLSGQLAAVESILNEPIITASEPVINPLPVEIMFKENKRKKRMIRKLLVVTAGTTAAEVGQELLRQIASHPQSGLRPTVFSIDTADLDDLIATNDEHQCYHMKINQKEMHAIQQGKVAKTFPVELLYDDVALPRVHNRSADGVRYNGAGALAYNQTEVTSWLTREISPLMQEYENVALSLAIVVSAAGATGSGSLIRLFDLIVKMVEEASRASTDIHFQCNTFIMMPDPNENDTLKFANTFALFAELAAKRLSHGQQNKTPFQGRTILVGWGYPAKRLTSIQQLEEITANIIRLSQDSTSGLSKTLESTGFEHIDVLNKVHHFMQVPSNLSLASAATINMSALERQIVERDTARLLSNLVFGSEPDSKQVHNPFLEILNEYIPDNAQYNRYHSLLEYLTREIPLNVKNQSKLQRDISETPDPETLLMQIRNQDIATIEGTHEVIRTEGNQLVSELIQRWQAQEKHELATSSAVSFSHLSYFYRNLQQVLEETLEMAEKGPPQRVADSRVQKALDTIPPLNDPTIDRRRSKNLSENGLNRHKHIQAAFELITLNVVDYQNKQANSTAIKVLRELRNGIKQRSIIFTKALSQFNRRAAHFEAPLSQDLWQKPNSSLEIPAISSEQRDELERYYQKVSPLSVNTTNARHRKGDPFLEFRQWLGEERIQFLYTGDVESLQNAARAYIQEKLLRPPVLATLLENGRASLQKRLQEAIQTAQPLITTRIFAASEIKEKYFVCASYEKDAHQQSELENAIKEVFTRQFGANSCKLVPSKDPTEIVVFHCLDGLSMASITDLVGQGFEAFMRQQRIWSAMGLPSFSSKDVEELVYEYDILRKIKS